MTTPTTDPKRDPGYRGSLPPREDRLAKPWLMLVAGIFVLIVVLSIAGIPSRFEPEPTPVPTLLPAPTATAAPSTEPSPSASDAAPPSADSSAEASSEASAEPSPTDQ